MQRICDATNKYASKANPKLRFPLGGSMWWRLDPMELKTYIEVNFMMRIKRLPNHRCYWQKSHPFLFCEMTATVMSRQRFEDITRCILVVLDNMIQQ